MTMFWLIVVRMLPLEYRSARSATVHIWSPVRSPIGNLVAAVTKPACRGGTTLVRLQAWNAEAWPLRDAAPLPFPWPLERVGAFVGMISGGSSAWSSSLIGSC